MSVSGYDYECVFRVCENVREYVSAYRSVCVCECARVFFRAHYQSAADLSLLSASTQMFGHRPFSKSSSGICKDKQREQFTQNNKSVMSDGGKVILVYCAFKVRGIYFYH